jgi:hypothetical protein
MTVKTGLEKLAPKRDPRVAIPLFAYLRFDCDDMDEKQVMAVCRALATSYVPRSGPPGVITWWEKKEADLRRRAKQLPQ